MSKSQDINWNQFIIWYLQYSHQLLDDPSTISIKSVRDQAKRMLVFCDFAESQPVRDFDPDFKGEDITATVNELKILTSRKIN